MNGQRVRRERKLILCLALLSAAVYGALLGLRVLQSERGAEERAYAAQVRLPDSPAVVEMVNTEESYVLTRGNGGWVCQGNEELKINSVLISYMSVTLKELSPRRVLPDSQAYLKEFGLTEPAAELTLRMSEGSRTYRVGRYNPVLDEYYMTVDGGDCVFLIGREDMDLIDRTLLELIAGPGFVGTDIGSVTGIHVVRNGEEYTAERTGDRFRIRWGDREFERSEYAVSGVYSVFNSAPYACCRHDADEAALAACGLDEPEISVEFTTSGGDVFLLEVGTDGEGTFNVRENRGGTIYRLSPEYGALIRERVDPAWLDAPE